MKIYIDIETIPTQNKDFQEYVCDSLKPPANYKNQETIDKWLAENKGEAVNKTSLDGAFGEIVVIGVAIDEQEPVLFYLEDWQAKHREIDILQRFNDYLREHANKSMTAPIFIGHNIVNFDYRFIFQRSVINGVKPYYTQNKLNTFDTMTEWAGYKGTVSLDKLCKVLGVEQKSDIDGSKVWDFVQAGKINEVAEYCAKDVERVRQVYKRMTFQD
ncbi:ribonuclease H-like domain-containing protein [Pasteurella multocida]|uniref:ribonuclease H-like domain-containing protein n=1 Tax=Pasteurella multocida TaxID=747 RepID=UPI00111A5697|nr:ribonuclease H-like domain-containing protein [Pasteurella multocida]QDA11586.1 ribonuclease H [Pasteurella multocida subsp. multocida]